ncbi:TPM domain-containing protein [Rhodoferax sp.]|uniref:TPM domain-containing protein n=1 Tax=Rhodoferax sp. TaxID=50421 RepID=UPI001ECDBCF3|nr:TPM domain-containing protein [Rhodoferax sp.]MBT9507254.1 TPM domain-containing protein [Rhodoferax sp.]
MLIGILLQQRVVAPSLPAWAWVAGLLTGLLFAFASAHAQQAIPPVTAHVMDTTGTLDAGQVQQLENKLTAFEQARGAQLVVLLVATTQPEDIASYANRVANTWKLGRREIGDGVLLIVAKNDRKVRVEVAKTLEGAIPDLAAKRVIDEVITPRFKRGDFAGGLDAGVARLTGLIAGEALPPPPPGASGSEQAKSGFQWIDMAIFLFIAVPVMAGMARKMLGLKLGALATGAAVGALTLFVTSSLIVASVAAFVALLFALLTRFPQAHPGNWTSGSSGTGGWGTGGSGGWSAGSGGGGFSSGGGGDFGGGGASGDW